MPSRLPRILRSEHAVPGRYIVRFKQSQDKQALDVEAISKELTPCPAPGSTTSTSTRCSASRPRCQSNRRSRLRATRASKGERGRARRDSRHRNGRNWGLDGSTSAGCRSTTPTASSGRAPA